MRRIGSVRLAVFLSVIALAGAGRALAEVELSQNVDRAEVGLDDVFRLTVTVSDAPDSAQLQFPASSDFNILSKSESSQMSYQLGGGGPATIRRTHKYTLLMAAKRVGTLTIPPTVVSIGGKAYKTEPVQITVKRGHVDDPRAQRGGPRPNDPFRRFGLPGFGGFDDEGDGFPEVDVPRSDSDLFLRSSLDRDEVFVGDQVTLSLYIFSRVDLSSVDAVNLPKLDGFWSEDVESPTQLTGEQKVLNGVPYRAYLLKRRALFPVKAGKISIGAAEADITTGFLFAGRRLHRTGNELSLKVKPLPPGAPAGFAAANVGRWRLSSEISQSQVQLGQPVTVKVSLEGRGNLKNTVMPSLTAPSSVRIYDPTVNEKPSNNKGKVGGRRVQEYLMMPQQTGSVTLPGLAFSYFNPETGHYETSKTDPIELMVTGTEGAKLVASGASGSGDSNAAKNVLGVGGLRPLRHQAHFSQPGVPLWRSRFFVPALLAPIGAWLAFALVGLVRARLSHEDEVSLKKKRTRAARRRLSAAEKLKKTGNQTEFYAEVEKALVQFLEAKLNLPVVGLTRDALAARMSEADVPEKCRAQVLLVLDTCDVARFAPGGAEPARERVLDDAEAAMESWEQR
jgi:hypothetical protein